jgi:hypothetical protein
LCPLGLSSNSHPRCGGPASCASRVVPQSARGLTGMVRTAALAPRAF